MEGDLGSREVGRLGGWEVWKCGGWEVGRLGSMEALSPKSLKSRQSQFSVGSDGNQKTERVLTVRFLHKTEG